MAKTTAGKRTKKPRKGDFRSGCPLATALDLIGDKWSLVIVRDLMRGLGKYQEFLKSPEGIPTNILAARLKSLEGQGIIRRQRYQTRPVRHEYALTPKGAELLPVLQQLVLWAQKYVPGLWVPPQWFFDATPADLLKSKPKARGEGAK
jgi:DNA-binding HxlR family transcriptional regulator